MSATCQFFTRLSVPFLGNPIEVWDPKLGFSSHFQVFDEGRLWQWHIADFMSVEGRNYGKWVSTDVALEPLDQIHDSLASLRNPVIKPGEPGHKNFKQKVEDFYGWLDKIRQPILYTLEGIHRAKRDVQINSPKVSQNMPPLLSRFEMFTVRSGEIYSRLFAAPVFFRASRQHAIRAEELLASVDSDPELVQKLEEIYQERANAIILGTACLEAFINNLGFEHFANLWEHVAHLTLTAKWQLFMELKGKGDLFAPDQQPYQFLIQLVKSRNALVHFKSDYHKVKRLGKNVATHVEYYDMPRQLVRELPDQLKQLIKKLCNATGMSVPPWLTQQPGWIR